MVFRRWLVAAMLVCSASPLAASPHDSGEPMREVSARVYDYAQFDQHQLQRAQNQVSETYLAAGVRVIWHTVIRVDRIEAGDETWPTDGVTTITVVVLGEGMGEQRGVPADVAGYAPITREAGGRVTSPTGGDFCLEQAHFLAAANRELHAQLQEVAATIST